MTKFSLDFPLAYGPLTAQAQFRTQPEDFQVEEHLGYHPSGDGEHVFLQVRKRGENTVWIAEKIAAIAGVNINDIGYCGRKDRHAVTTQWFSVYLPKPNPELDWSLLNSPTITLLSLSRHHQKLRRGGHQYNHFVIRLRNLITADKDALDAKIKKIFVQGVPNYFGEQRFGHNGNNLHEAQALLMEGKRYRDKQQRGFVISSARSYLFNLVLAVRVKSNNWLNRIDGEIGELNTGPLWGRGRPLIGAELLELETEALKNWMEWCTALEYVGLSQERRLLILMPENTAWCWINSDLQLSFTLGSGEFATAILREISTLELKAVHSSEGAIA